MSVLDEFSLEGQRAVVTGAGRGLGNVMATAYAEAGADVAIVDVDAETAEQAADEIAELGVETTSVTADVSDEAEVEAMTETVVDRLGGIDILLNNAGIVSNTPAEEMPVDEWQATMDVNLTGVFLCSKHVGRHMLERGSGTIVNISSMSGLVANHPQPQIAYNASKAGVIMVTRSLASEWGDRGVRVNSIAPGYMRTDLVEDVLEEDPEMAETWREYTPMGRLGKPTELGPVAVFLASEASSFMNGEIVSFDGGYTVR
ncbi:SDR family NAD(P)-dependent oxidoreductase [Halococcus hamelinensis]|uniref:3-oxoacyl-[acyl-carrier protein] reductase n=1 Tax=Halococcus hamelinensis 100A6 TaxID=1132509 RepID=M0M970_9EURY|nr:glucose 1-dehydrogenase [Halococcus hamelinensis]EMA40945.1 3-oxoacyl-[acyl-carrier protein] reductase [Halococcus hamelinensis 100A6]